MTGSLRGAPDGLKGIVHLKVVSSILLVTASVILLAACAAQPATPSSSPPNPAAAAAVRALAEQLKIPESQISVASVEATQWPDSCLGLPNPGEMCAMHVVPGYRIVVHANGNSYEFHTNQDGSFVRQAKSAPFY